MKHNSAKIEEINYVTWYLLLYLLKILLNFSNFFFFSCDNRTLVVAMVLELTDLCFIAFTKLIQLNNFMFPLLQFLPCFFFLIWI